MKMVYTHENRFLINTVIDLIEAQHIKVFLKNEYAQGASGELSPFDSWPEVWVVNDSDFIRAKRIVESIKTNRNIEDWVCNHCSEKNDASFEICWKCQHENS